MGNGGGAVLFTIGEDTTSRELDDDWLLIHELVHLSSPDTALPWADEGLATYLEPLIRARAGLIRRDDIWSALVDGLPMGQPEAGDRGLDHTDTWGRRYWGGAMFWFLADLEIRKATNNQRSLDDAMREVNARGGNVSQRWDLDSVLGVAEQSAGAPVLKPLRKKLGDEPFRVDLDALWKSLGVSVSGGKVTYDDAAPLASMRKGIDYGAL
jgi:predicted metalloprotease with PDZ domain